MDTRDRVIGLLLAVIFLLACAMVYHENTYTVTFTGEDNKAALVGCGSVAIHSIELSKKKLGVRCVDGRVAWFPR